MLATSCRTVNRLLSFLLPKRLLYRSGERSQTTWKPEFPFLTKEQTVLSVEDPQPAFPVEAGNIA